MVVVGGMIVAALPMIGVAEVRQGASFAGPVAGVASDVQRVGVNGKSLGDVAAGVKVAEQGGGEPGSGRASRGRRCGR